MPKVVDAQQPQSPRLPDGWDKLSSALLSDALDAADCRGQAMSPRIRPLDEGRRLCGRARRGQYVEVDHVEAGENPHELEIAIVDHLNPGDVAVFAYGGSSIIAPRGSLLSTATRAHGAAVCVTDGFVRDTLHIRAMKLPLFHGGIAPLDSKGRGEINAIDVPVICDGAKVTPGDLVFGDADGVVVVPQALEAEVLRIAFERIGAEHRSMGELKKGAYLRDVYAKYGVL